STAPHPSRHRPPAPRRRPPGSPRHPRAPPSSPAPEAAAPSSAPRPLNPIPRPQRSPPLVPRASVSFRFECRVSGDGRPSPDTRHPGLVPLTDPDGIRAENLRDAALLDLVGGFVDPVEPDFSIEALERELLGVAHAAVDLEDPV